MNILYVLLLIAGAVCFAIAVVRPSAQAGARNVNLVALGLFFWILVPLIEQLRVLAA